MKEKLENYLISVTIFEGRHYAIQNMDSYVLIHIVDKKKCTKVQKRTDCPYYNEYFTFEFTMKLQKLLDNSLTFTVIQPASCCRKKKILGFVSMDIATIWEQPDHQFYHKWAVISAEDFAGGPKGYIKVDIAILTIGDVPKIPLIKPEETDIIEGNLLLPEGMTLERQRANFIFNIYRGEGFLKNTKSYSKDLPNICIEVLFVGLKGCTSVQKATINPVWNESLTFTELFPPLCQRIKFVVKYMDCLHNTTQAIKYINIRYISNDQEYGFLPTFGPTFLHFYSKNNDAYAGKLLLSLDTILYDESLGIPKNITVQSIQHLKENELWKTENVLLFASLFEVSHINKNYKDKPMGFEIYFGKVIEDDDDESGDYLKFNKSINYIPKSNDGEYWFLQLEDRYPCLNILSIWPDFRKRLYLCNMINKITDELTSRMEDIENLFKEETYGSSREIIQNKLIDALDYLSTTCRKCLDIIHYSNEHCVTNLDKERLNMSLKEMEHIEEKAKEIYEPLKRKKTFRKLHDLYKRMEFLLIDEQECWPDIFIWVICGDKKITYIKIPARNVIYSNILEVKGKHCGVSQDIFFKTENEKNVNRSKVVCKANLFLWIGLERDKKSCFSALPENFTLPEGIGENIPTYLIPKEQHIFQCRTHIYQGRINPGDDSSGLSDPFVRVIIKDYCKKSKVVKKSLNPLWDETILFQNLVLYGTTKHINEHPPNIILELFDKDLCCKEEFVGRTLIIPHVFLKKDPYIAPKLNWYKIIDEVDIEKGEILCTTELLEVTEKLDLQDLKEKTIPIPAEIKPNLKLHRIEVLFWGFRKLKKVNRLPITRPNIVINCCDVILQSATIHYNKTQLNFDESSAFIDVQLPEQDEYSPPIIIKLFDSRSFGRNTFAGIYISLTKQFKFNILKETERNEVLSSRGFSIFSVDSKIDLLLEAKERQKKQLEAANIAPYNVDEEDDNVYSRFEEKSCFAKLKIVRFVLKLCKIRHRRKMKLEKSKEEEQIEKEEASDEEDFDWWTKYYNSLDPLAHLEELQQSQIKTLQEEQEKINESNISLQDDKSYRSVSFKKKYKLKIFNNELELQPEFNGFTDTLQIFPMFKGKRTGDDIIDKENITGIFKGALRIYECHLNDDIKRVTPSGYDIKNGAFQEWPSNEREPFLLRIYCVKGVRLMSKDTYGKSDAYICIKMGKQIKKNRKEYIANQFNPVFGKCFELKGHFPEDNCVTISVWDHDKRCSDDLIGETKIDIENRFYTKHRARCGLSKDYVESGHSSWRGQLKPSQILESYCKLYNVGTPIYTEDSVIIANKQYVPKKLDVTDEITKKECISLYALQSWHEMPLIGCHLVPEHVETRSLYHPSKPGIEQGKLEMWIDIFPIRDLPPPPQVDITPRKPISYELRVIIWNIEDVILNEDDFFTGDRKSDVFVKGWLTGQNKQQSTDVHYRSLNGEGNFNWRFVFPFDYVTCEKKLVIKKSSMFDEETEEKYPCRLKLQVWDNDTISRDDFLGSVALELYRLPRGAKTSKRCTLSILSTNSPKVNLFKIKRTRGWWPFRQHDKETHQYNLSGKVEAEFELLLQEEAETNPAGLGRDEPQALAKPNRPESSFSFLKNPLKALKYLICKLYRCKIIICCTGIFLICFILVAFYAFPGYTVKRILGA